MKHPILRRAGLLWASLPILILAAACSPAATAAPATVAASAPTAVQATVAAAEPTAAAVSVEEVAAAAAKLNLNTATAADFLTVPGVGDRMVREFQEYRPYVSIEQFRREIGKYVDDAQVAAYEEYVYVPISANAADAATLLQIPGLDAAEAQALIDGRPYTTNADFLAALGDYISSTDLTVAAAYLSPP